MTKSHVIKVYVSEVMLCNSPNHKSICMWLLYVPIWMDVFFSFRHGYKTGKSMTRIIFKVESAEQSNVNDVHRTFHKNENEKKKNVNENGKCIHI